MEEKKKKASSKTKKVKTESKRNILFKKAKELKINNYQKLTNDKLEEEIKKIENTNTKEENDISLLSRTELINIAQELKIKNYSKLKKDKLIEEINNLKNNQIKEEKIDNKEETNINIKKDEKEIPDNLQDLSKNELVEFCKIHKVKNYSKISKNKIVKILNDIKNKKNDDSKENPDISKLDKKNTKITKSKELKKDTVLEKKEDKLEYNKSKKETKKSILKEEKEIKRKEQEIEDKVKEDAKHFQDDVKTKILFMPSKYGFGKTNEEFLLEDEKDLNLKPSIIDVKNEITLMPIDPYKAYVYWTLSAENVKKLHKLKIRELILKLNDVTGIVYNGENANSFWFEKTLLTSPNWYINMPRNNFNLCIELGYLVGTTFFILAKSNVVHIPTSAPSPVVNDEFVIVDFNVEKEEENKKEEKKVSEPKSKLPFISQEQKLPKIKRIPKYFIKEYDIKQEKPVIVPKKVENFTLPPKLPKIYFETINEENIEKTYYKPKLVSKYQKNIEISKDNFNKSNINDFQVKEKVIPTTKKYFEDEKFENINLNLLNDKRETFYYRIPKEDKIVKIYYSNHESIPYQRIVYYSLEPVKIIHEKIYKISYGPYWSKEFIGGSERIKFLGASERFLGASDIFMGASERFLGGSDIFMGASERFLGASDIFIGASDIFLGASEKQYHKREKYYKFSEPIDIKIDKYIKV